jgi:hypothetical protein
MEQQGLEEEKCKPGFCFLAYVCGMIWGALIFVG